MPAIEISSTNGRRVGDRYFKKKKDRIHQI